MAARRLLILMLILLGISSVIAVIIPNPRRDAREQESREQPAGDTTKESATGTGSKGTADGSGAAAGESGGQTPASGSPAAAGSDDAGPRKLTLKSGPSPTAAKAEPGERLILTVEARNPSQVIVPALGLTGFADRWAPAVFDLILPPEAGRVAIYTAPPSGQPRTRVATIKSD